MSNNHTFAHAEAPRRHGMQSAGDTHQVSMKAEVEDRLRAWFSGAIALTRSEAHSLLERAVESGSMVHHRAEFVLAIKALAAGPRCWHEMGYRLLPDD